jgi:predicted GH43/DUF377 family glycosyl hydrolase
VLWLAVVWGAVVPGEAEADSLRFADSSRGRPYAKDPSVIFFQDQYFLYYSVPPQTSVPGVAFQAGWGIAIATSTNLEQWTKVAELAPAGDYEQKGLCAPGALVIGGKVHLFYQTYGNGPKDAICHATSGDGVRFERDPSNPIFRPTGSWTSGRAIDAEAFVHGDRLLLYFATRDPGGKIQKLGLASAPVDSDYSRVQWRQECIGSILAPELDWEKGCIEAPTITRRGDVLYMFYAGGYNNEPQQIGLAVSKDGLSWKRVSERPFLANGPAGSWNESESGHPGIFTDPKTGRTWLFYQGNNDKGKTWFISKTEVRWEKTGPVLVHE